MENTNVKITGYIWYNSVMGKYQKGTDEEYKKFLQLSGCDEKFSLILKLTTESDILAYKIVKQLNAAREEELSNEGKIAV